MRSIICNFLSSIYLSDTDYYRTERFIYKIERFIYRNYLVHYYRFMLQINCFIISEVNEMKKWENAEIMQLNVTETKEDFCFQFSLDGGYLGDGKISGWFGKKKNNNPCGPENRS